MGPEKGGAQRDAPTGGTPRELGRHGPRLEKNKAKPTSQFALGVLFCFQFYSGTLTTECIVYL